MKSKKENQKEKQKENKKGKKVIDINSINPNKKKINIKKIIIVSIIAILILLAIVLYFLYSMNVEFRKFCDNKIFLKNIEDNNLPSIEIDNVNNSKIFAWKDYIAIIEDNNIIKYNNVGKKEAEININITSPIIATNEEYAVVAENEGNKIYLLYKNNIAWQKEVEGNISRVSVNCNGYVSIILSDTAYKSVIVMYDNEGNELFKTYLSSTIAIDSEISNDNKYLYFAEVNISGTLIQSNIKEISVEKAKKDSNDSIIYTYNADANSLIVDIKYQNNKLICEYDDSIHTIENGNDEKIITLDSNEKNNKFIDIGLENYIAKITESSESIFNTSTIVEITNVVNKKVNTYNLNGTSKELYCCKNKICINLGSEVHFIDTNGWLIKKYTASQENRGVVMSDSIAGIIYKDKIEIINL